MDEDRSGEVLREIQEVKGSIDKLFAILEGNGEGGLKTKVAVLETQLEAMKESRSQWRNVWPGVVTGLIVALGGAAILAFVR